MGMLFSNFGTIMGHKFAYFAEYQQRWYIDGFQISYFFFNIQHFCILMGRKFTDFR